MKRFIVIVLAPVFMTTAAFGADDAVTRATRLYEKRHYEEASSLLRAESGSIDQSKQATANLVMGMSYLKNAQLHRELHQAAVAASQDYLKKLSAERQSRSRYVDFYLGDVLLETGKPGVAAIYLEKFSGSDGVEPRQRAMSKACLGLCYYENKEIQKAQELWATIDVSDPEVKAELAAAYARAGLADKNITGMVDESMSAVKRSGKPLSMRMVTNVLAVFVRMEQRDKALDLLKRSDLKLSSYRETIGKSKVINFYDVSLLGDMALLYGQLSISHLEKAALDPKTRDASDYYLAQAHALFGSLDKASKVAAAFVSSSHMPQSYKDRIRVWQGANLYQKNHVTTEAIGIWDELSRKQPEDPDVLAEILLNCSRLRIECAKIMQKSTILAESGEGKKAAPLNIAIGTYFLGKLDSAKAAAYLEAGRDKSNKNKIESNDPAMLVSLADAYYRTKKFSESLEIYFEMSKQFPEVRQIQDVLQGVYAVEHKSAGDVKIN